MWADIKRMLRPGAVVVTVPSIAESLSACGAEDLLEGIDTWVKPITLTYPEHMTKQRNEQDGEDEDEEEEDVRSLFFYRAL